MKTSFGLYLHIPYCRALCHYCDFAKTAHFDRSHVTGFFQRLEQHAEAWLSFAVETGWLAPAGDSLGRDGLTSVFLGGGTPSLFSHEYAGVMELFRPFLAHRAEVSLEANPDDIGDGALSTWKSLGVNRLSLGVQTFQEKGLRTMRRVHTGDGAWAAISQAIETFPNLNVDLIYGWPDQTRDDFVNDLEKVVSLGVPHLSLYNMTFERQTPLGRAASRGVIKPHGEDDLFGFYDDAMALLARYGYLHEEVSNWSKPGASCSHNWLYWDDAAFIGIGPGAHGYLPASQGGAASVGVRYAYPRSDRTFLRLGAVPVGFEGGTADPTSFAARMGVTVEEERSLDHWLTEYVGASLRTKEGTSLTRIEARLGRPFRPTWVLQEGMAQGLCYELVREGEERRLVLTPQEWFREVAWGVELISSFAP